MKALTFPVERIGITRVFYPLLAGEKQNQYFLRGVPIGKRQIFQSGDNCEPPVFGNSLSIFENTDCVGAVRRLQKKHAANRNRPRVFHC